jgi:hypothetical protein
MGSCLSRKFKKQMVGILSHYTPSFSAILSLLLCVPSSSPNSASLLFSPYFSLISAPLLCASSCYKVVTLRNSQGVWISSPRTLLLPLLVSPLETLSSMSCLFIDLSSYVLLSSTTYSYALPPGAIYFLFILFLTPHHVPLDNSSSSPFSSFLLISTLLVYLSNLVLLCSSGSIPFLTSSQQFLDPPPWIHFFSQFPHIYKIPPPPPMLGDFNQPFYRDPCTLSFSPTKNIFI